jgi:hypothetical protein
MGIMLAPVVYPAVATPQMPLYTKANMPFQQQQNLTHNFCSNTLFSEISNVFLARIASKK